MANKDYGAKVRIFDAGDKVADRYTVLPPRYDRKYRNGQQWVSLHMGPDPFHPQGFGQHGYLYTYHVGPHLGKRINWSDLPAGAQAMTVMNFPEYCPADTVQFRM